MAIVVEGVKTLGKGLLAVRAEVALMTIGHFAVFVGFGMTAEPTFHSFSAVVTIPLLYQTHIILTHYHLTYGTLLGASCMGSKFVGCNFTDANLSRTYLYDADFREACLVGTGLHGALYNRQTRFPADYDLTESGAYLIAPGVDLSKTLLSGMYLATVQLTGANLKEADLQRSDLAAAHLEGANLTGANLTGANLRGANLTGAVCDRTCFIDANLTGATLPDGTIHA